MREQIEIKRKVFDVIEHLGNNSMKVERKGKAYFYKDFSKNLKGYEDYVSGFNSLKITGIRIPKCYVYDKYTHEVISDYIEGNTVLEDLLNEDLKEEYFQEIFLINYHAKKERLCINFSPENFKYSNGKLYYLSMNANKGNPISFEKSGISLWFYSKDFVQLLISQGIEIDRNRADQNQGYLNKKIALTTVKFYR